MIEIRDLALLECSNVDHTIDLVLTVAFDEAVLERLEEAAVNFFGILRLGIAAALNILIAK